MACRYAQSRHLRHCCDPFIIARIHETVCYLHGLALFPFLCDILKLYASCIRHKSVVFCWVPSHVGILGNERVDVLAGSASTGPIFNIKVLYTDFIACAKVHFRDKWQHFWDQQIFNKLQAVHPKLGCWPLSNRERRREQLVLCRLRIGHTYLTHRYLLAG